MKKDTVKTIFKSLISNAACVDGGREKSWVIALVFYLLSIIIAVIPTLVNISNSYGSSFITSNNYGMDVSLSSFAYELEGLNPGETQPVLLRIDSDDTHGAKLSNPITREGVTGQTWSSRYGEDTNNIPFPYQHTYQRQSINSEGDIIVETIVDFEIYFFPEADNTKLNTYVTNILANKDPSGIIYHADARSTSFMAFGRYAFVSYIYKPSNTTAVGSYTGNYRAILPGTYINDLSKYTLKINDTSTVNLSPEYFVNGGDSSYYSSWINGNFSNWKGFFNDGYITTKNNNMWVTTLMSLGIFALLGIFMGVVIFIITRGKSNPYRYFTFWDTMKMSWWAMLSPAILAMIVGFFMSSLSMIGFVILFGMRVMWMSMRTLKPVQ